jgi:succinylglutamate desuccinylase
MKEGMSASLQAVATGDLARYAACFQNAGFSASLPARGVLRIISTAQAPRPRLLLSVGVHGDETAPIELLAGLLEGLTAEPHMLGVDLVVVVANLAAIDAGTRFIDADLNRMFRSDRGALQASVEAARADAIMQAAADFFAAGDTPKWHLDLHTAIRASRYPTFAVVPEVIAPEHGAPLLAWLASAGIGAAILSPDSVGTFSAYSAQRLGASSATVELGRVAAFGANDLRQFGAARAALERLLHRACMPPGGPAPHLYRVAQQVTKHSERFVAHFDDATENFAPLAPGSVIAEDGGVVYRAGPQVEYLVFPNPEVRTGLRAGLTVVRCS